MIDLNKGRPKLPFLPGSWADQNQRDGLRGLNQTWPSDADIKEARQLGRDNALDIVTGVRGKPNGGTRAKPRWGSLELTLTGRRAGKFRRYSSGEHGDMLDFLRLEQDLSFQEAVRWVLDTYGCGFRSPLSVRPPPAPTRSKAQIKAATEVAEDAAEREKRLRTAHQMWARGTSIDDTLAERYLTGTRAIPRPQSGWPSAVRFYPRRNALMLAVTNNVGDVQAIQLVYLTDEARKRSRDGRHLDKQTLGRLSGCAIRLPGDPSVLLLAEGPETGLSAWAATGRETWIVPGVSNYLALDLEPGRRVVVCADDDPPSRPSSDPLVRKTQQAAATLKKAVRRWLATGVQVDVIKPYNIRQHNKADFNDLLREAGLKAVHDKIEELLRPGSMARPYCNVLSIDQARWLTRAAVARFFTEFSQAGFIGEPIVHAIKIGVGIGKSDAALREAAKWLTAARARNDKRTIVVAVPRHDLGDEMVKRVQALPEAAGLTSRVWRGRTAQDPCQPGEAMCHDLEAVKAVQEAYGSVSELVCGSPFREPRCPFFKACGYQKQMRENPDLWFVPHELIFTKKPGVIGNLAALLIDERIWDKGLIGTDGKPRELPVSALGMPLMQVQSTDREPLRDIHRQLEHALARSKDGPLSRAVLLDADLTLRMVQDGERMSYDRKANLEVAPGMSPAARLAETRLWAPHNRMVMRLGEMFGSLVALLADGGPEASGWVELATRGGKDGLQRFLRLAGRKKIGEGWQVPTLLMDATLDPVLNRFYWPNLQMMAEIQATTPYTRYRQLVGAQFTKGALLSCNPKPQDEPKGGQDEAQQKLAEKRQKRREDDNRCRQKRSYKMRATVLAEARKYVGSTVVFTHKGVEEDWRAMAPLPNIEIGHYYGLAGLDCWRKARLLVVLGRPEPAANDLERIAAALTGAAVTTKVGRYNLQGALIHRSDGSTSATEISCHPDPVVEAIRRQYCEDEIVQAIGRGRAVNRTATDPLDVLILTDRALPLPIDALVSPTELNPSMADLMLAEGGVAMISSPSDASRAYPNLWRTPENAKQAANRERRARSVTFPNRETLIWGMSPTSAVNDLPEDEVGEWSDSLAGFLLGECDALLRTATYRRAGAGMRPGRVVFDPRVVAPGALQAWLEERLGPLASLVIEASEPEPEAIMAELPDEPLESSKAELDPLEGGALKEAPADIDLVADGAPNVVMAELLDGLACRWCHHPMSWRGTTAVTLGDGTSLHGECRTPFRKAQIARACEYDGRSIMSPSPQCLSGPPTLGVVPDACSL